MKIALNMGREGEHFMREEYCYFDGKVKRCRNFVTLTASTYHPILKKQIPLAIMETEKEDSENIELFWTLFNTSIKKAGVITLSSLIPLAGARIWRERI